MATSAGIVLAGVLLCLLVLTGLHSMLDTEAVRSFDLGTQAWVHSWEATELGPWITRGMLALTWLGAVKIFAISWACVVAGLLWRGHRHGATLLGLALSGAFGLNEWLKLHFHRARPVVPWSLGDEHTYSFPSGHSLFSVTLYGTLTWLAWKHGWSGHRKAEVLVPAVLLPLGIGVSRIYLGEHWPSDVIAGWTCGLIWAASVAAVDEVYLRHRRTEEDQDGAHPDAVRV